MKPTPPLHTARLDLQPVAPALAAEAWKHVDDERMWRYFEDQRPATMADLRRLYEKWARGSPAPDEAWNNWLCRDRNSGQLVGSMQATVHLAERFSYIAYGIYPEHRRKGYARDATGAVIGYVLETYGIDRFVALIHSKNKPSCGLAESLGFTRVDVRDAEYVYELRVQ